MVSPMTRPSHVPSRDLELYVIDALAPRRAVEVEEHLAECAECSAALMREAQVEMSLFGLAKQVALDEQYTESPRSQRVKAGLTFSIAATVSLAAAFTLFVARPAVAPPSSSAAAWHYVDGMSGVETASTRSADGLSIDTFGASMDGGADGRLADL